jgi:hypothetical protein
MSYAAIHRVVSGHDAHGRRYESAVAAALSPPSHVKPV